MRDCDNCKRDAWLCASCHYEPRERAEEEAGRPEDEGCEGEGEKKESEDKHEEL